MTRGYVGRPMQILLVEDNLLDARLTIKALRKAPFGYRLNLALDGDEASRYVKREGIFRWAPRPDLVLLDLVLPKKSGFDVLTVIRAQPELERTAVVVLTASDLAEERERCASLHVDLIISKPVDLTKFLKVVGDLAKHWHEDIILPFARGEMPDPEEGENEAPKLPL